MFWRYILVIYIIFYGIMPSYAEKNSSLKNKELNSSFGNQTDKNIPLWLKPSGYSYSSIGKIDPFVSFLAQPKELEPEIMPEIQMKPKVKKVPKRTAPLTPLQRLDATQLKVVGILWYPGIEDNFMAMVELPDGKGFILKKGEKVGKNDGNVTAITSQQVLIKEHHVDIFGDEKTKNIFLKLHSGQGGQGE